MVEGIPNLYESQNAVERKLTYLKTKWSPWIVLNAGTFNSFVAVYGLIWLLGI